MGKIRPWDNLVRPYPSGYEAPSTGFLVEEEGKIIIGDIGGERVLLQNEEEKYTFSLLGILQPIPLETEPVINYQGEQTKIFAGPLKKYAHAGIRIMWTGYGCFEGNDYFYRPKFLEWIKSDDNRKSDTLMEFRYLTPPASISLSAGKVSVMYGLGGPFPREGPLSRFQQHYVKFFEEKGKLNYSLTSLEHWWKEGYSPPHDLYCVGEKGEQEKGYHTTLLEYIRGQNIILNVLRGYDAQGIAHYKKYVSLEAERFGATHIRILFGFKEERESVSS